MKKEYKEKQIAYLHEVARKLSNGRDHSIWLTQKQTAWIQSAFVSAGIESDREYGEFGYRRTRRYYYCGEFEVGLSVSPLNQCGQFHYVSPEQVQARRDAAVKKEAEEIANREELLKQMKLLLEAYKATGKDATHIEKWLATHVVTK